MLCSLLLCSSENKVIASRRVAKKEGWWRCLIFHSLFWLRNLKMLFWKVQTLHTTKCLSVSHLRSSADRSRTHFQHAFYKRWLTYLQHFRRWAFVLSSWSLEQNRGKGSKYGINSRGKLRGITRNGILFCGSCLKVYTQQQQYVPPL